MEIWFTQDEEELLTESSDSEAKIKAVEAPWVLSAGGRQSHYAVLKDAAE